MNAEKTGAFIAAIRGERKLTQKELADKIGVTDKAVSKWECGRGFPDVGILEILSNELGVSVTELINGERFAADDPGKISEQSDSAVTETLRYMKQMSRKTLGIIIIIIGAFLCSLPLVSTFGGLPVLMLGIAVIIGGVFMITTAKNRSLPKTTLEFISLGALIAALILETLPNGVIMWWATPPGEPSKSGFFPYFSLMPFGNAHFTPLITAALTVALTVLTVIALIIGSKYPKLRNALFVCLVITTVISVCPVLYEFKYVTPIGICVTAALLISAIFRAAVNAKR